jgi:hypothetical protein
MTYDGKDGYVVLFGGCATVCSLGDTWKFVGGSWIQLFPSSAPTARWGAGLAYDAKDGNVVLFGGRSDTGPMGDTWTFANGQWTALLCSTTCPPARYGSGMTYDTKDGYVLLFGGTTGSVLLSETWTFAGGIWTQRIPSTPPPARYFPSLAYDSVDSYAVLFGGEGVSKVLGDTWKFVGNAWTNITTSKHPSPRLGAAFAFDAKDNYALLYGGADQTETPKADTWKFLGGSWTNITSTAGSASGHYSGATAYDVKTGYTVLFGGYGNGGLAANTTWKFVGGKWSHPFATPVSSSPARRDNAMMTYDAKDGYVFLFGGFSSNAQGSTVLDDDWSFVHGRWTTFIVPCSPTCPGPRYGGAMVYDAKDQYVLLFGGFDGNTWFGDTWKYAGGTWTALSPTTHPLARSDAGMAYDARDGYVVLFGGSGPLGYLSDTWTFAAGQWTRLSPNAHPSTRADVAMAYDAHDSYVVLFGGFNQNTSGAGSDTWKFVGGAWTNITATVGSTHPSARFGAAMTYDPKTGYLLLFGGEAGSGFSVSVYGDSWKFVAGAWAKLGSSVSPPGRALATLAFDTADAYALRFAGTPGIFGLTDDTWKWA